MTILTLGRRSTILEALKQEERQLGPFMRSKNYQKVTFIPHAYKSRGLYEEQIKEYLKYFSAEQMLILKSEDFFTNPAIILRKVCQFVGVDSSFEFQNREPKNVGRNKENVDPSVYEYLDDFFEPYNQRLYKLLDRDFGWGNNRPRKDS